MKKETNRQITLQSLPTRLCFIFFSHRTKILKSYGSRTFAFAADIHAKPMAKSKELNLPTLFKIQFFIAKLTVQKIILVSK